MASYQFVKRDTQANRASLRIINRLCMHKGHGTDHEQHMAPATGLLTQVIAILPGNLRLARLGLDMLGLIPLAEFSITTRCIRPGRTIELIESVMSSGGRDCIIARAWRLVTQRYYRDCWIRGFSDEL